MSEPEAQDSRDQIRKRAAESIAVLETYFQELSEVLDDPKRLRIVNKVLATMSDEQVSTLNEIVAQCHEESGLKWVALVLLDETRAQVVASKEPIPSSIRDQSYCQMPVAQAAIWKVEDATKHPLVSRWSSTVEYKVGAYMGTPVFRDGEPVGALCMFGPEPRQWTEEEEQLLAAFAHQVNKALEPSDA